MNVNGELPKFSLILAGLIWVSFQVPELPASVVQTEGTVLEVSDIPDPAASVYPDCLFTLKFQPRWQETPLAPVLLVLRAYMDRTLTPQSRLQPGDRIYIEAQPFVDMPPEYRSLCLADSIDDLDLTVWAGLSVLPDAERARVETTPAERWVSMTKEQTALVPATVSASARARRRRAVQADLEHIQSLKTSHGGWENWYRECEPLRNEITRRATASPGSRGTSRQPILVHPEAVFGYRLSDDDESYRMLLHAMEELRRQFQLAGTDLVVAPIPKRDEVYALSFVMDPPEDGVLHPDRVKFFHDLLVRDIEAVDLLPAFRERVSRGALLYHDNTTDGHVSGEGARLTGELLAPRLDRYTFDASRIEYNLSPVTYTFASDSALARPDQPFLAHRVFEPDWSQVARDVDGSEVLVIGDSMLTAPSQIFGTSVGLQLMHSVGIPLTFFKRAGSAPQMARFLAREGSPFFFSGRKVCVFVFAFDYVIRRHESWDVAPFVERWTVHGPTSKTHDRHTAPP